MTGQTIILRTTANRDFAVKFVSGLKTDEQHPLEIEIRQHRKKRSLSANALYWKWLGIVSEETGNDVDALHEWAKRNFSKPRPVTIMGDVCEIYTTAKMTVGEMSEYMDRFNAWAASEGIILPQPEDRAAA